VFNHESNSDIGDSEVRDRKVGDIEVITSRVHSQLVWVRAKISLPTQLLIHINNVMPADDLGLIHGKSFYDCCILVCIGYG